MAFLQSSASNFNDFLGQLSAFAVANAGFTALPALTLSTSSQFGKGSPCTRLSKGGYTWMFAQYGTEYGTGNIPEAYHSMITTETNPTSMTFNATHTPPVNAVGSLYYFGNSPFTNIYFFTDGLAVHFVIELTTGVYCHGAFGSITKLENFNGGEFVTATFASRASATEWNRLNEGGNSISLFSGDHRNSRYGSHRPTQSDSNAFSAASYTFNSVIRAENLIDADTGYNRWAVFGSRRQVTNNVAEGSVEGGLASNFSGTGGGKSNAQGANKQNKRTPMWENFIRLGNFATNNWRISGHTPHMRLCFCDFIEDGGIIDGWQVFPLVRRGTTANSVSPATGNIAIAYKRA